MELLLGLKSEVMGYDQDLGRTRIQKDMEDVVGLVRSMFR